MSEKELREYCREASLDISNMQNQITKLQQENKALKEQNEFLMKRDNRCQALEQRIKEAITMLNNADYEIHSRTDMMNIMWEARDILKEVE